MLAQDSQRRAAFEDVGKAATVGVGETVGSAGQPPGDLPDGRCRRWRRPRPVRSTQWRQEPADGLGAASVATFGDLRGQAGVRMNVPIYRNRLQAAYCQAVMRLRQKQAEFEQKQLDISYEVQSAYEQLEESRKTVALYRDRYVSIAEQSVKAARANYEANKGSFLELLTAQRRLFEAQLMQQEAVVTLHRRKAELDRMTGAIIQRP